MQYQHLDAAPAFARQNGIETSLKDACNEIGTCFPLREITGCGKRNIELAFFCELSARFKSL
jgi:hypothetical protein